MQHWQVKEAAIRARPPQSVQADGEVIGETPVQVRVRPGAVRVLASAESEE